tara:strand:+ start:357 stop:530 length:174 start_codon:yes stop_codon:yes gene_type:complete
VYPRGPSIWDITTNICSDARAHRSNECANERTNERANSRAVVVTDACALVDGSYGIA